MKLSNLLCMTTILMLGNIPISYADDNDFLIRTSVDMKYAFCDVKTNGVSGTNNRSGLVSGGLGFGTTSTNSMIMMRNGENTISIEMASPNWFSTKEVPKDKLNQFNPNAKCEITINKITDNGEIIPLTTLLVKINEKGEPEAYQGDALDRQVEKKVIKAPNTEKVHQNRIRQNIRTNEYPHDMTVFQFNKKISVTGLPEWEWVNAERYQDTPEQRKLLQAAYLELWTAFNQKDLSKIKHILAPSLKTWAETTGGTIDEQFESREIATDFNQKAFAMIPITWDNFVPLVMNDGKMVKLVYKEDFDYSPISYSYFNDANRKIIGVHSPIFSLVNGKFIPVI
ncbi:hypothetical protein [Providencia rettgeri]|uniref:hypothetical protein n=1 Tax=Providencia rettgeri TaxID=587 RepID=UPI0034E0A523